MLTLVFFNTEERSQVTNEQLARDLSSLTARVAYSAIGSGSELQDTTPRGSRPSTSGDYSIFSNLKSHTPEPGLLLL